MFIQQKSALSAFTYEIFNSSNELLGELNWPDFALAKNSNLKSFEKLFKNTKITFNIKEEKYTIDFEFLNRQWFNDIEFTLIEQKTNNVLSFAQAVSVPEERRKLIIIKKPFVGKFNNQSGIFRIKIQVLYNKEDLCIIEEPKGIQMKRKIELKNISTELGQLDIPVQVFFLFLALNAHVR